LTAPIDDISSTDIRRRIADNKPWQHLVPPAVAEYIDEHRLYRQD
jgi:nicotinate-nucleotide adenylyltransferase